MMRLGAIGRWTAAAALALLGFAAATERTMGQGDLSGRIKIDGSSTVYPIAAAVAEEFLREHPQVRVTVGMSGTGGGFRRFITGETDISNASRPIKASEAQAARERGVEYIELPVAYDGLTIVVNKANTWSTSLTIDELKRMFLEGSTVRTWRDVRPEWPDVPVHMFIPGPHSGTFDYFKEVVAGDNGTIRSDVSVSEDDNVLVRGVAGTQGAVGFFGFAFYFENRDKISAVAIDAGRGPVRPEVATIADGSYAPFSRPVFIYVSPASAQRAEVRAFVEFYLDAAALVREVGYVPLPADIVARSRANFRQGRVGTQFLDERGQKILGPLAEIYR